MPDPATDDDAVRRLLAEARHDEPLPPEVAARLDVLLGRLVEVREQETGVVSLGARRQRRRGLLLLAAAAAVVVGVAVPAVQQIGRSSSDDASSSASDSSVQESATSDDDSATSGSAGSALAQPPAQAPAPAEGVPAPTGADAAKSVPLVVLTAADFERQVRRAESLTEPPSVPRASGPYESQLTLSFLPEGCTGDLGDGFLLGATYDGTPAALAYRPVAAGGTTERVDLLTCDGSARVIRTTTIPVA